MSVLHQNEPHEQIETIENHGPLCKRIKSAKKTSSNQPCGRDSETIIGAFLKSFNIIENPCCIQSHAHLQTLTKTPAKFRIDPGKIVGGVAFTRYPVSKCSKPKNDYV